MESNTKKRENRIVLSLATTVASTVLAFSAIKAESESINWKNLKEATSSYAVYGDRMSSESLGQIRKTVFIPEEQRALLDNISKGKILDVSINCKLLLRAGEPEPTRAKLISKIMAELGIKPDVLITEVERGKTMSQFDPKTHLIAYYYKLNLERKEKKEIETLEKQIAKIEKKNEKEFIDLEPKELDELERDIRKLDRIKDSAEAKDLIARIKRIKSLKEEIIAARKQREEQARMMKEKEIEKKRAEEEARKREKEEAKKRREAEKKKEREEWKKEMEAAYEARKKELAEAEKKEKKETTKEVEKVPVAPPTAKPAEMIEKVKPIEKPKELKETKLETSVETKPEAKPIAKEILKEVPRQTVVTDELSKKIDEIRKDVGVRVKEISDIVDILDSKRRQDALNIIQTVEASWKKAGWDGKYTDIEIDALKKLLARRYK
ncbi:MAG: hypothetical protein QW112_01090 [Candidatus Micrarchaeia archaeon]